MKRLVWLAGLMALSSPACARDYSFVFRGHDIHIEAARHCRSLSCVSVLIGDRHNRRDRDDDEVAPVRAPAAVPSPAPLAQAQPAPAQTAPAATRLQTARAPVAAQAAPVQAPIQATAQVQPTQPAVQTSPPAPMPVPALASEPAAPAPPPSVVAPPARVEQPASIEKPLAKPQLPARIEEAESDPDTPIGDWKTDSKANWVRIESCGAALCGYVLDAATHTKGKTVLINMKSKSDTQWTGNVYSRASGNSYYGRMTLKDGKTLRVEACALGSLFCSGNNWTRIDPAGADDLISSQATRARS